MKNIPENITFTMNLNSSKEEVLVTVAFILAGTVIKIFAICSCFSSLTPSSDESSSPNITSNSPWTPCGLKSCFVRREEPALRTYDREGADMIAPRAEIVCAGDKLMGNHLMSSLKMVLDVQLQQMNYKGPHLVYDWK